jgi:hypothetical protein
VRRNGAHDLVGHRRQCQDADVAVLERPFMPEGYFDRLFAVIRHSGAPVAKLAEVDDSEPYL